MAIHGSGWPEGAKDGLANDASGGDNDSNSDTSTDDEERGIDEWAVDAWMQWAARLQEERRKSAKRTNENSPHVWFNGTRTGW